MQPDRQFPLKLRVMDRGTCIAQHSFLVELPELKRYVEFRYYLGGPRAARYPKYLTLTQDTVYHPTAPPASWPNEISYTGRIGDGWWEYLPSYSAAVPKTQLVDILRFCFPNNRVTAAPDTAAPPPDRATDGS